MLHSTPHSTLHLRLHLCTCSQVYRLPHSVAYKLRGSTNLSYISKYLVPVDAPTQHVQAVNAVAPNIPMQWVHHHSGEYEPRQHFGRLTLSPQGRHHSAVAEIKSQGVGVEDFSHGLTEALTVAERVLPFVQELEQQEHNTFSGEWCYQHNHPHRQLHADILHLTILHADKNHLISVITVTMRPAL